MSLSSKFRSLISQAMTLTLVFTQIAWAEQTAKPAAIQHKLSEQLSQGKESAAVLDRALNSVTFYSDRSKTTSLSIEDLTNANLGKNRIYMVAKNPTKAGTTSETTIGLEIGFNLNQLALTAVDDRDGGILSTREIEIKKVDSKNEAQKFQTEVQQSLNLMVEEIGFELSEKYSKNNSTTQKKFQKIAQGALGLISPFEEAHAYTPSSDASNRGEAIWAGVLASFIGVLTAALNKDSRMTMAIGGIVATLGALITLSALAKLDVILGGTARD